MGALKYFLVIDYRLFLYQSSLDFLLFPQIMSKSFLFPAYQADASSWKCLSHVNTYFEELVSLVHLKMKIFMFLFTTPTFLPICL